MKKSLPFFISTEYREKYLTTYKAMFSLWKVPHESAVGAKI